MKDFKDMKTAEMLVEFNVLTGQSVKKFADRVSAERRLAEARNKFPEQTIEHCDAEVESKKQKFPVANLKRFFSHPEGYDCCPKCGSAEIAMGRGNSTGDIVDEDTFSFCHSCDWEFDLKNKPKSLKRSISTSESWNKPEIAEKRKQRNAVAVENHGVFRSVKQAFEHIGLNKSKHIKFRLELKNATELTYVESGTEYSFSLATISKEAKNINQKELPLE